MAAATQNQNGEQFAAVEQEVPRPADEARPKLDFLHAPRLFLRPEAGASGLVVFLVSARRSDIRVLKGELPVEAPEAGLAR